MTAKQIAQNLITRTKGDKDAALRGFLAPIRQGHRIPFTARQADRIVAALWEMGARA